MKNLIIKGVDFMKNTKDNVKSQFTQAQIINSVALAKEIGATHVSISVPLNTNAQMVAEGSTPSPLDIEDYYELWCDEIHAQSMGVLHRGALCGMEGIYDFTHEVGSNRIDAGDSSSTTDVTHLGKIYEAMEAYIGNGSIISGDILGFCPERTEGIFSDSTSFLPSTAPGLQTRYTNFFTDMKTICDARLSAHAVTGVTTGYTANNWTEVSSGWLQSGIFSVPNIVAFDHYGSGSHLPADMDTDLDNTYNAKSRAMFHQEWGNQETHANDAVYRNYLRAMFDVFTKYANNGKMTGFNYWGGWSGNLESLFTGSPGSYTLSVAGEMLRSYYRYGYYRTSSYMSFAS